MNVNTREPVYLQVVRHFKEQIAIGNFVAGQEIPSRRELAASLNINPNTAQKAYKEMEEQGLIHTERNFPSQITTNETILQAVRQELILAAVDTFVDAIRPINVPVDELLRVVKEKYSEEIREEEEK
ncbi:GntR family transcriptional regulator [Peribacillus frigoritolerans]|jgi:DNA-binding transcriptional regulator YhcF (GntR family)|uniref:GntR family transcriptional regulator n=1 Tax=Peribacillus frigoritolerans TaxID=450367 RepID=A0A561DII8_9BACI|nr:MULTISPECIES: GntR family transcriptional regulator [Bacillaceae]KRF47915.1 GntR family transcriptional regulator [Bacillus sp. Soil745]MBD8136225.1 GntR family transcriptional regulator [Bacillus sp. CFBP 13597]PEF35938.1 GntR family transcriptional regulator [Bacillus sp. AFS094228]PEO44258.1 GntR family transcriptional regulator [Bacillus sp. AFS026049]PHD76807.1 GntR family transcriptional regulator [Bacillus sp. AFS043905]QNK49095.1 GntR family transcriptional regulator [Brevibacteriu